MRLLLLLEATAFTLLLADPGSHASATPPPEAARAADPFMIYFEYDSIAVPPPGQEVLSRVLNEWQARRPPLLSVEGHADTSHPAEQSMDISRRRAWAVRDWLVEAGVPGEAIRVRYHGEERPLVETGDEIREPLNRRVEIRFADAPEQLPR